MTKEIGVQYKKTSHFNATGKSDVNSHSAGKRKGCRESTSSQRLQEC